MSRQAFYLLDEAQYTRCREAADVLEMLIPLCQSAGDTVRSEQVASLASVIAYQLEPLAKLPFQFVTLTGDAP